MNHLTTLQLVLFTLFICFVLLFFFAMHVNNSFVFTTLPRSIRSLTLLTHHSNSTCSIWTNANTDLQLFPNKRHWIYQLKPACCLNANLSSLNNITRRTLSSSSPIDVAQKTIPFESIDSDADPKLESLKEFSFFVVKRSPTRHFSQVCYNL